MSRVHAKILLIDAFHHTEWVNTIGFFSSVEET